MNGNPTYLAIDKEQPARGVFINPLFGQTLWMFDDDNPEIIS